MIALCEGRGVCMRVCVCVSERDRGEGQGTSQVWSVLIFSGSQVSCGYPFEVLPTWLS